MKGIILAGGNGTRLSPSTSVISKHLIPIYDKPMIYYPLSILMLAGIKEILMISNPEHLPLYKTLFDDGSRFGLQITYMEQQHPKGIADAFILGEDFIGTDPVSLILGDNVFYGDNLSAKLSKCTKLQAGGIVFGYYMDDPTRYGVLEFTENNKVVGVQEKPKYPKSNYAIPGMYFFDHKCVEYAKNIQPSARGELEITEIIQQYIKNKALSVEILSRGFAWLDTGTHEDLIAASTFVHAIEKRQGLKIACLEEIAYNQGFINLQQLQKNIQYVENSQYGVYLQRFLKNLKSKNLKELSVA